MTQPFITAMQAALDTHGLPDGIASVHVGTSSYNASGVYCVIGTNDGSSGSQPTLALAMEALQIYLDGLASERAERDAARAALVAAGLSPDLVRS